MERAIKDLCRLSDPDLFEEIATGIGHVMEAVNGLGVAVRKLYEEGYRHPARVLDNLATEEAAKVLVLVDAVRCPRNKSTEKSRTLGYFYDHLAKGIYAAVTNWSPANFAEVMHNVDRERQEHYLDGPNDVDWIFPNSITQRREDDLYVGYVRDDTEEGGQGERRWTPPSVYDQVVFAPSSAVVRLASALHETNATTPKGLSVIAKIWRSVDMRDDMGITELMGLNWRTLEVLDDRGLLASSPHETYAVIRNDWIFPLWSLDLRILKVEKKSLREVRQQWSPDGY